MDLHQSPRCLFTKIYLRGARLFFSTDKVKTGWFGAAPLMTLSHETCFTSDESSVSSLGATSLRNSMGNSPVSVELPV